MPRQRPRVNPSRHPPCTNGQQPHSDLLAHHGLNPFLVWPTVSERASLSVDDVDALMEVGFPAGFAEKANKRLPVEQVIYGHGSLSADHMQALEAHIASGETSGLPFNQTIKALRHTHHRIAQLVASGMEMTRIAAITNRAPQALSHLMADPAFAELVAHYRGVVDEEFADFTSAAAGLSMDMLSALQDMLDTSPEKFGPGHIMDAIKLLADRTGHAPVTKSVNVNVNADVGSKMQAARERLNSLRDITPSGG